ncbi:YchJ family protein [Microbacterium sp. EF45047]|uniref:YchJ family protein n=1 Tax=Microbacterium sp. EF45047 TaxID=2809708 RepID=UPI00234A2024|nr:YchJ family protein [Microbacterium sp. EF45047]WCM56715.1 YchJ family protein [Microbacterium sp. EF45047]
MPHRPDPADRCPCTSGDSFGACCGPVIASGVAPTAERLMRSRFTAFAIGDADHILASWHPSTRPAELELDPEIRWTRLDVLGTAAGGPFDSEGVVTFEAFYRHDGERGSMRERSRFRREGGRWYYLDGAVGRLET